MTLTWAWLVAVLAVLVLVRFGDAGPVEEIWLLHIASISCTPKGWCAGPSIIVAAEIMLEEIRRNPDLLPGYDLKLLHQDDSCEPDRGMTTLLEDMFNERYKIVRPDQNLQKMDLNGDRMIVPEELDQLSVLWNRTQVKYAPVGLLGMGCSPSTRPVVQTAYYMRLPFLSTVATFAALSDRTRYPNFFRMPLTDSLTTYAFVGLTQMLGHHTVVTVTDTGPDWPLTVVHFAEFAVNSGLILAGRDYKNEINFFSGLRVSVDSPDSYRDAVNFLVSARVRIVILLLYLDPIHALLCEAFKQDFLSAVYMVFGWLEMGWWNDAGKSNCDGNAMTRITRSMISADQVTWRLDLDSRHACTKNMTAAQFEHEWFARQGLQVGDLVHESGGYSIVDYGAPTADAICMYALMLQEMLFVKKISLAEMSARTQHAYDAQMEIFGRMEFEGFSGNIQFTPGKADRTGRHKLSQLQDGKLVLFATFEDGRFDFLGRGNISFHFPGETFFGGPAGASRINASLGNFRVKCKDQQILNFSDNECYDCPEDTEYVEFARACLCRRGYHKMANTSCVPCLPGKFSASPGASCRECDLGKYQHLLAATACTACEEGRYAAEPGNSQCTSCPTKMTTEHIKSESAADCKCDYGSFTIPGSAGDCFSCPERSTTQGLGSVNQSSCYCTGGDYMDRTGSSSTCRACPPRVICHEGSYYAGPQDKQHFEVEAGFWVSVDNPLSVFRCRDATRCVGGPPGSNCAPRLQGAREIACEHCERDYFWDGERCQACIGFQASAYFFPVMPLILLPLLVITLYIRFRDDLPRWGSWQNTTTALFFIVLNHYQIIAMLPPPTLSLPKSLQGPRDWFPLTTDPMLVFNPECIGFKSLVASMAAKAVVPLLVILTGMLVFYGSRVAARFATRLGMDPNRLFNVIASIMFTCFGAVSAMSLLLFQCINNPNGETTLAVDLSIRCWSSQEWKSALGIGIACILVYIVLMGSTFVYAVYITPRCFCQESFRRRWKFLFIKFHAGAFWWGIVFLLKNFLLTIVPVFLSYSGSAAHYYFFMVIVLIYLSGVVMMMPYRAIVSNLLEMVVGVCILFSASLLTWFLPGHAARFTRVLDDWESRYIGLAALCINLVPLVLFLVFGAGLAVQGNTIRRDEHVIKKAGDRFELLRTSYEAFVALDPDSGTETVRNLAEGEVRCLLAAALVIRSDVMGSSTRHRVAKSLSEKSDSKSDLSKLSSGRRSHSGETHRGFPRCISSSSVVNNDTDAIPVPIINTIGVTCKI